ncbi:MAG: pyruvate, phosphate dikinase [Planctomycetes bacterium]|nr:pyruvate, phosphate dikinase [Planctomycetota bacterium]
MIEKYVYNFGKNINESNASMVPLLGGKGANLAEMCNIGLPVPPGFTITTQTCKSYFENNQQMPEGLNEQIKDGILRLEKATGQRFGKDKKPLLVSVRSGSAVSMPGMMDTILNLGLNDVSVLTLAESSKNPRMAWDCYRRLVEMFGNVVKNIDRNNFEKVLEALKEKKGVELDTDLDANDMKALTLKYKEIYKKALGVEFPQKPWDQLVESVEAVFKSWNNQRAKEYRKKNRITGLLGTAVNVQMMVFGNLSEQSGTGVAFTRDGSTGDKKPMAEYLFNAQGEDIVAGIRTPHHLDYLKDLRPALFDELMEAMTKLEEHYEDMQDIEFTFQDEDLYILQTRRGKRTAFAAIRIAVEMVQEGLITTDEAIMRLPANDMQQILAPVFNHDVLVQAETAEGWTPENEETPNGNCDVQTVKLLTKGIEASPGAATGYIAFSAEEAVERSQEIWVGKFDEHGKPMKKPVILVRGETSAEDVAGMFKAEGILTARGGKTSHAAVVARGEGKPCVVGCRDLKIDEEKKILRIGDLELHDCDFISLDGTTGKIYSGMIPPLRSEIEQVLISKTIKPSDSDFYPYFMKIMNWAQKYRKLRIYANADTEDTAAVSVAFNAEGIGLCRTEHMFFEESRIMSIREVILFATQYKKINEQIDDYSSRKVKSKAEEEKLNQLKIELKDMSRHFIAPIQRLKEMQTSDFHSIFKIMEHRPVIIRLLDPPLHEFLPKDAKEIEDTATKLHISENDLKAQISTLEETNPMLGHRGCRLGITFPEIYQMQAEAIITAACEVAKKGVQVHPEIMVPFVSHPSELRIIREMIEKCAKQVFAKLGITVDYKIGTMIEIPRAALIADQIAEYADFFSFGTNDMTQMGFGLSRDDADKFIPDYLNTEIFVVSPFESLDRQGIGRFVELGFQNGKSAKPELEIGICGEHGGESDSIEFFHNTGLLYVSCSPRRLPGAWVAAAQANIKNK